MSSDAAAAAAPKRAGAGPSSKARRTGAPHGAASSAAAAAAAAAAAPEFLVHLKYRNQLPDVPCEARCLRVPFDASRWTRYAPTSLESRRDCEPRVFVPFDAHLPFNLVNSAVFESKPQEERTLLPAERELLRSEAEVRKESQAETFSWIMGPSYGTGFLSEAAPLAPAVGSAQHAQQQHQQQQRQQQQQQQQGGHRLGPARQQSLRRDTRTVDEKIEAIQRSFDEAEHLIPPHNSDVQLKRVFRVHPDPELCKQPQTVLRFHDNISKSLEQRDRRSGAERGKLRLTGAVFRVVRELEDDASSNEVVVEFFAHRGTVAAGNAVRFEYIRDYVVVGEPTEDRLYVLRLNESRRAAYFAKIDARLNAVSAGVRAPNEAAPSGVRTVLVKFRELDESEIVQAENRFTALTKGGDDDEDDDLA